MFLPIPQLGKDISLGTETATVPISLGVYSEPEVPQHPSPKITSCRIGRRHRVTTEFWLLARDGPKKPRPIRRSQPLMSSASFRYRGPHIGTGQRRFPPSSVLNLCAEEFELGDRRLNLHQVLILYRGDNCNRFIVAGD
jgi:hypothetical protein